MCNGPFIFVSSVHALCFLFSQYPVSACFPFECGFVIIKDITIKRIINQINIFERFHNLIRKDKKLLKIQY